jgi:hypothetical protein
MSNIFLGYLVNKNCIEHGVNKWIAWLWFFREIYYNTFIYIVNLLLYDVVLFLLVNECCLHCLANGWMLSNFCHSILMLQSDRFFNALKGHGALSRLVILPFESHGYSARESIMHVLWESDRWLQNYCVNITSKADSDASAVSDNKTVSTSGGSAPHEGLSPEGHSCVPRSLLW